MASRLFPFHTDTCRGPRQSTPSETSLICTHSFLDVFLRPPGEEICIALGFAFIGKDTCVCEWGLGRKGAMGSRPKGGLVVPGEHPTGLHSHCWQLSPPVCPRAGAYAQENQASHVLRFRSEL